MKQLAMYFEIISLFFKTLFRVFKLDVWRKNEILSAVYQSGVASLPIVTLSTAFAGIVVTQQMAWHMSIALSDVSMIPGFTGQFIFRELGIAIPALLLVSKVGASITAEVGTMKVTDQIDALKLLQIDPIDYLVFPRFIASMISSACLRHFIGPMDVVCALVKGITFGSLIPIISCAYGFKCRGGAEGVGSATTNSVVTSTIAIIILDFLLTYLFTWIL
ncbi:ABC transporter permease [bacterium]|nr:ABC transporter permease [bacterium]